jgi:hypothetical protein
MLDRPFRRHNAKTKLAATGLLAGMILAQAEWYMTDTRNKRPNNHSETPMGASQGPTDFMEGQLKVLLTDFGVPVHNIPGDFVEKVRRWVRLYQTRDRDEIELVLESRRHDFEVVRQQVASADLPPDLAFLTLVESHFQARTISADDNAGLWQFTRNTARHNGLKVNARADERLDPQKSTEAACRYFWQLKQQLGRESSLMLVLAAYNMGPGRLEQRTRQVEDLSKRRDFWYLYRQRLLPALTRTHLARLMAAILIGRQPQHFGLTVIPSNLETVSSATSPF